MGAIQLHDAEAELALQGVTDFVAELQDEAEKASSADHWARKKGWKEWAQSCTENSGRGLFSYVRGVTSPPPRRRTEFARNSGSPSLATFVPSARWDGPGLAGQVMR